MALPFEIAPVEGCVQCRPYEGAKAGQHCSSCPAFGIAHYYPLAHGSSLPEVVILGDVPVGPRKVTPRPGMPPRVDLRPYHPAFDDDGGKVFRNAVHDVEKEFGKVQARFIYAVKCAVENPRGPIIHACQHYLQAELEQLAQQRAQAGLDPRVVILAAGPTVFQALGMRVGAHRDTLGRVYRDVQVGAARVHVVPTRSAREYAAVSGQYPTLLSDLERALRLARNQEIPVVPREELLPGYVFPKTLVEVQELIEFVEGYGPNGDPASWAISADTETNTLHPHWKGTKLLAVTFAWDVGRAAAVALDHPGTPYDWRPAYELCLRLLRRKRTIWHNGKYDWKVFWRLGEPLTDLGTPVWDSLLAEHLLEEDKKMEYGLKQLVKRFLPQFAGYEDRLHDLLVAAEEQAATGVALKVGRKEVKVPEAVIQALKYAVDHKYVTSAAFREPTVEKLLHKPGLPDDARKALTTILAAKRNGEFSGAAQAKEALQKRQQGGFENVPLDELLFYGAVDADVTRRLALLQRDRMEEEEREVRQARAQLRQQFAVGIGRAEQDEGRIVPEDNPHPLPAVRLLREFKLPRQRELAKIEYLGVKVDQAYLEWGAARLGEVETTMRAQLFELAGETFLPDSGKQVAQRLFFGGPGFIHPDPKHAEEIAQAYPEEVRYKDGRITYVPKYFTSGGQPQTGEVVMKMLVSRYRCPFANLLLAQKKAYKTGHTLFHNVRALSQMFEDGMLHGGYNLIGTATDRLSSSSGIVGLGFNYQNINKGLIGGLRNTRGDLVLGVDDKPIFEGVSCKKLFLPDDPSMCFGNADAKGAEVTIFGTYAYPFQGGEALVEALIQGLDAHCFFASNALNPDLVGAGLVGVQRRLALERAGVDDEHAWSYDDFKQRDELLAKGLGRGKKNDPASWETPALVKYALQLDALRDNIKRLVFGMLFGAGVAKTAAIAGISLELATQIRDLLFTKFPSIRTYMEQTKWELARFGLVETFDGGRRRFPINPRTAPRALLARASRQAINVKIQRTNSDIVLMVLCWIAEALERDMGGRVLLTVHDSIGFQVPKKYAHQIKDLFYEHGTRRVAQACPWLKSPYRWDVTLGPSYGEQKPIQKYLDGLPAEKPKAELEGYTRAEMIDDLMNPDVDVPEDERKRKKK